ncbi:unnamed protein product [Cuscuta epithymum]|uniref:FRIGIDA-like protein n=1 Tax=Cuscuta epithymum TaxID=186058 RepID=A0AAV0CLT8_9ASTE|nr:unnamed protein product [Cuscuta epithymum]
MAQPAIPTSRATSPPLPQSESNKDPAGSKILTLNPARNSPPALTETMQSQQLASIPSKTIANLQKLSTALSAFQRCFNDLQGHISSIQTAIDSVVHPDADIIPAVNPETAILKPQLPRIKKDESPIVPGKQASSSVSVEENKSKSSRSELEDLCRTMNSRGLRKYMASQLSEISKLREEVPNALKLAPNVARLVLDCSGRFFLQGSKAFADPKSPMVPAREASVLILECFLLMGNDQGAEIEKSVKEEAEQAAGAWRKRLINEGGLGKACKMDARGLLLLIAGFGISGLLEYEDFRDLFQASNANEIKTAIQKSGFLMSKISEVIDWMVKNKMEVDAADLAYTCGLEKQINPQKLLISFLRESKDSYNKRKATAKGSPSAMMDSNKKQLSALKSVLKCLEGHKVDPAKLLPGWQINEMIAGVEKEITELNKITSVQKRRADEPAKPTAKLKTHNVKRSRVDDGIPKNHLHSYYVAPTTYPAGGHGSMTENMIGGVLTGGPGAGGVSSITNSLMHSGGPYVGSADMTDYNTQQRYQLRSDSAAGMYERIGGSSQSYAYVPSSSLESSLALRNAASAGRNTTSDHYPSSLESSIALRNTAPAGRKTTSHHYQYADVAALEIDAYHGISARSASGLSTAVPSHHHTSYMF